MPSKRQLLLAAIVCLTMTSCGSLTPHVKDPLPPQPLVFPAAMIVPCPQPVKPADSSMDAIVITLKLMYDLYGLCAGRFVEVINYAGGTQ